MSNFWFLLCKYTQDLIFLLVVIGFDHKEWSCKMRQCVRLKWGHSKVVVNLKKLESLNLYLSLVAGQWHHVVVMPQSPWTNLTICLAPTVYALGK